jgi:hypothetical protein
MLDVYGPHETSRSWKSFLFHIATIVVGLFIAVTLEQTVDFFHHRHQRKMLEEQMHEVLADEVRQIETDSRKLIALRAFLVELQTAVVARRHGQVAPAPPPTNDPRLRPKVRIPSLAPYEAAKANGTVALLSSERIRLYNRLSLQRDLTKSAFDSWFEELATTDAFVKRFEYASGTTVVGNVELTRLSPTELAESQTLIGTLLSRIDWIAQRLQLFSLESRAILDGARDESDLIRRLASEVDPGVEAASPSAVAK